LIDRRRQSSILDVRSFRGTDSDTDHYLVVANFRERLAVGRDDKDDFVADSHSTLARWRKYFSQLLNVHGVNDVMQAEVHTAEPLVPEPIAFEVELTIES
jgi:hypothetical protein